MKFLICILIISSSLQSSELSHIVIQSQAYLRGAIKTNILKYDHEFEGSELEGELMVDVLTINGEERYCYYFRKKLIRLYKTSKQGNCLGEILFSYEIRNSWSWSFRTINYLNKNIMGIRFQDKNDGSFYELKFPNMQNISNILYEKWDQPRDNSPFGFKILSN